MLLEEYETYRNVAVINVLLYGTNDESDEGGTMLCTEDGTLDNFVDPSIMFDVELNRCVKRLAEREI